jgi:hypothetical protein
MKNLKQAALMASLAALAVLAGPPSLVDGAAPEAGMARVSLGPLRDPAFIAISHSSSPPPFVTAWGEEFMPPLLKLNLPANHGGQRTPLEAATPPHGRRSQPEVLSLLMLGAGLIWGSSYGRRRLSRTKGLKIHEEESIPRIWRKTLQH